MNDPAASSDSQVVVPQTPQGNRPSYPQQTPTNSRRSQPVVSQATPQSLLVGFDFYFEEDEPDVGVKVLLVRQLADQLRPFIKPEVLPQDFQIF